MENKATLKSKTVQNTILLPLWGCAVASDKNDEICSPAFFKMDVGEIFNLGL